MWAIFASGTSRFCSHKTFFFADLPAKMNSSQFCRLAGGKALRWLLLLTAYVIICRNSTPGSTGGCVPGGSAAYENFIITLLYSYIPRCIHEYQRHTCTTGGNPEMDLHPIRGGGVVDLPQVVFLCTKRPKKRDESLGELQNS